MASSVFTRNEGVSLRKIIDVEEAINIRWNRRNAGKTVVLAGGCFDILHPGHIIYLEKAKRQGEILFVALESDENVRRLKGPNRPHNSQKKRAVHLSEVNYVDYIILLPKMSDDQEYYDLTNKLAPDIIAITQDDPKQAEKEKQVKAKGGKVVEVTARLSNYSTTHILKQL